MQPRAHAARREDRDVKVEREVQASELLAYTIDQFCALHGGISRATFYKMQKEGSGPRLIYVGARALISVEEAAAWRKRRVEDAASEDAQLERERRVVAARTAGKIAGQSPLHVSQRPKKTVRKGK